MYVHVRRGSGVLRHRLVSASKLGIRRQRVVELSVICRHISLIIRAITENNINPQQQRFDMMNSILNYREQVAGHHLADNRWNPVNRVDITHQRRACIGNPYCFNDGRSSEIANSTLRSVSFYEFKKFECYNTFVFISRYGESS